MSQTRISTVPYSGLGRMSQYRSLMLSARPLAHSWARWASKRYQSVTSAGMWPASGKLLTALRRQHENRVSTPSQ
ncbi:Uncharacterised protein [Bordetella pertussis]|nr:Uncharacterised protein [Bordetella pertussis]CFU12275.1 Uncharacterised protein [Bordetella pertussis]CFW16919.1 Uncharacterised protein [Bordetella pertussis]CFW35377.1 Uncharacterised protein [Bordetella pertussis]